MSGVEGRRPTLLRFLIGMVLSALCLFGHPAGGGDGCFVPILAYHRFGPTVADAMTVRTQVFEVQILWLRAHGYTVIPLRALVDARLGLGPLPEARSVVIRADDGQRTLHSDLLPVVRKHGIPVTLFIYPSAISKASYAMTWAQLKELQATGLFDIQSHTLWHPNFRAERHRLPPGKYTKLVESQLQKSKQILEAKLGGRVDLLAWPFGIHDPFLERQARSEGYVAAFSIEGRHVGPSESVLALPRYLMTDRDGLKGLRAILARGAGR